MLNFFFGVFWWRSTATQPKRNANFAGWVTFLREDPNKLRVGFFVADSSPLPRLSSCESSRTHRIAVSSFSLSLLSRIYRMIVFSHSSVMDSKKAPAAPKECERRPSKSISKLFKLLFFPLNCLRRRLSLPQINSTGDLQMPTAWLWMPKRTSA